MQPTCRILGIAGSLRRGSYNRGLLRAALEVVPDNASLELVEIRQLPLYDADLDASGPPAAVEEFKQRLRDADALLIATPEYNYSIPGVLKNAIDWASRPPAISPLRFKPIALMGATTGGFGTTRAQLALRQCFVFTESYALLKPEVMVSNAADHFDADGNLLDQQVRERIRGLLAALVRWAARFPPGEDGSAPLSR